jgi:hypothetical protein
VRYLALLKGVEGNAPAEATGGASKQSGKTALSTSTKNTDAMSLAAYLVLQDKKDGDVDTDAARGQLAKAIQTSKYVGSVRLLL